MGTDCEAYASKKQRQTVRFPGNGEECDHAGVESQPRGEDVVVSPASRRRRAIWKQRGEAPNTAVGLRRRARPPLTSVEPHARGWRLAAGGGGTAPALAQSGVHAPCDAMAEHVRALRGSREVEDVFIGHPRKDACSRQPAFRFVESLANGSCRRQYFRAATGESRDRQGH